MDVASYRHRPAHYTLSKNLSVITVITASEQLLKVMILCCQPYLSDAFFFFF